MNAHEVLPQALAEAALRAGASPDDLRGVLGDRPPELVATRDPAYGDLATNLALVLAKPLKKKPRAVAEALVKALQLPPGLVERVEIAGPGFINFFLKREQRAAVLHTVLEQRGDYGHSDAGRGRKVNV